MQYFGLIAEGPTNYAILENILIGYFNKDISGYINELQPKQGQAGGWERVLNYCASIDFKNDFVDNDFMIIQIDTDRSYELNFGVSHEENDVKLSVEALIEKIKERFNGIFASKFGENFISEFGHRILFAVSVHSIECWLLPLYYENETKALTRSCLHKLNEKWLDIGEPSIGENKKRKPVYNPTEPRRKAIPEQNKKGQVPTYEKISRYFMSNDVLNTYYLQNPSLKIFIEKELKVKIPL
jgi:hypothetical protein